jgi:predicted transcriptional regulator
MPKLLTQPNTSGSLHSYITQQKIGMRVAIMFKRDVFKQILLQNDLSQVEFCNRAGVSLSTLKRVLANQPVTSLYFQRIVNAYRRLDRYGMEAMTIKK